MEKHRDVKIGVMEEDFKNRDFDTPYSPNDHMDLRK